MNENNKPEASPVAQLANLIAEADDVDMTDFLDALKPVMAPALYADLALQLDICPIHHQDLDSCGDDDWSANSPSRLSDLARCREYRTRP
jgi:hypothetical protein